MPDKKAKNRGKKIIVVAGILVLFVILFVVPFKHKKNSGESVTTPIVPWYEIQKTEISYWLKEPENAPTIGEWYWPDGYVQEKVRVFGITVSENKYLHYPDGSTSEVTFDIPDFVSET